MARALRIEHVGGSCQAFARGNERRSIPRDDAERFHFLPRFIAAMLATVHRRRGCALSL